MHTEFIAVGCRFDDLERKIDPKYRTIPLNGDVDVRLLFEFSSDLPTVACVESLGVIEPLVNLRTPLPLLNLNGHESK